MSKPTLTYFDFAGSRGEECRLAFAVAGVDFIDCRVKPADWAALKSSSPFGAMPYLELEGKPMLAQSNAILGYIGRTYGLHPTTDVFEAARHEALMAYAEELRHHVNPVLRIKEEAARKAAREELAATYLPAWAANVDKQLGDGPFVAGAKLHVVDIKLYMIMRWFVSGSVDHVPATVFEPFPRLMRLYHAVADHPGVKAWQAR